MGVGKSLTGGIHPRAQLDPLTHIEPHDQLPNDPRVIHADDNTAHRLTGWGYAVADPAAVWPSWAAFSIGIYRFHWDGSSFQPGDAR